jgi:hypothetical protein
MQTNIHFWSYLARFFLEWEMFETKGAKKIKTHILCSVTSPSPRPENLAVCEIMWKNMPQMPIWRMHIACWIPKATDTHSEYVTLTAFPLKRWLHERAPLLLYVYWLYGYLYCLEVFTKQYLSALHNRKEPKWRRQCALWTVVALRLTYARSYSVNCGGHQRHVTASVCTAEALTAATINRVIHKINFMYLSFV